MALSTEQQILIEQRVANDSKSVGLAYLLWFFLGGLGMHRFYLGKVGSGLLLMFIMIVGVLTSFAGLGVPLIAIGLIWLFVDMFLIPGIVRDHKNRIRADMAMMATAMPQIRG